MVNVIYICGFEYLSFYGVRIDKDLWETGFIVWNAIKRYELLSLHSCVEVFYSLFVIMFCVVLERCLSGLW